MLARSRHVLAHPPISLFFSKFDKRRSIFRRYSFFLLFGDLLSFSLSLFLFVSVASIERYEKKREREREREREKKKTKVIW